MQYLLQDTSSGAAVINDVVVHLANPDLPFGGVGESGMGTYHGWVTVASHVELFLRCLGLNVALPCSAESYPSSAFRTKRV